MAQNGNNYKHGYYGTPTYKSWSEMKRRCNHNVKRYKNITYCEKWEKFENFLKDMGERPKNMTLDRIDNNGNYEPNNCRWANYITQANNKSSNKYYLINNEKLTLSQIARKFKISRSNLANKIYIYKWDINKAIKYLVERGGSYGK
jgi:hypothetical protein